METRRGREREPGHRFEAKEFREIEKALEEIDRLLADLVEKSVEWDPEKRQTLRQRILGLMQGIGINGFEDYEGFIRAHERVRRGYEGFGFSGPTDDTTVPDFADPKGYFAELGISPKDVEGKSELEIKELLRAKYYELVKTYHPDLNPNNADIERLKRITVAYGILSKPEQRTAYMRQR